MLKLSVRLETLAGERIAAIETSQVFRDMLNSHVLGSAEVALQEVLDVQVVVPCRALIRAHVNQLQEQASFTRLDDTGVRRDWIDGCVSAALLARLDAAAAETRSEPSLMT